MNADSSEASGIDPAVCGFGRKTLGDGGWHGRCRSPKPCVASEIPVFRDADRPIVRMQTEIGMAAIIHKNLLDLPPCSGGATLRPEHAVDWLIDTCLASDGDIVLCPVGPLTNIAMAIQKEPRILDAILSSGKVSRRRSHHRCGVLPSGTRLGTVRRRRVG
jgi:Inosine-uridine preferring nucleoside hydrolase